MTFLEEIFERTGACTVAQAARLIAAGLTVRETTAVTFPRLLATVEQAGVKVITVNDAAFEGMYRFNKQREEIVLRSSNNSKRLLFTLAHEIGHMLIARLLAPQSAVRYRSNTTTAVSEEEQLANAIAAEILMPTESFRSYIGKHGTGFDGLEKASRAYGVSFRAVLKRLADVKCRPVVFINVIPSKIFDVKSPAMIDEFTILLPGEGTKLFREEGRITTRLRFCDLKRQKNVELAVRSPLGMISAFFETRAWSSPCENVDLLATL